MKRIETAHSSQTKHTKKGEASLHQYFEKDAWETKSLFYLALIVKFELGYPHPDYSKVL